MFDGDAVSCWNSDQGSPQFLFFDFLRPVVVKSVSVMFQGGFVGQDGYIEVGLTSPSNLQPLASLDLIEDNNDLQTFAVENEVVCRYVKVSFATSTDFYGRVTIYKFQVMGSVAVVQEDTSGTTDNNNATAESIPTSAAPVAAGLDSSIV
jgi:hypothetical protein